MRALPVPLTALGLAKTDKGPDRQREDLLQRETNRQTKIEREETDRRRYRETERKPGFTAIYPYRLDRKAIDAYASILADIPNALLILRSVTDVLRE